ncbi:MAG: hypothetical protein J0M34_02280 [Alphaproteobacteria bacterium]|nr:hypothetical protein [Alphaproteobacteria bacterium]
MAEKSKTSLEMRVTLGIIVATFTGLSAMFLKASGQGLMNRFMKTKNPLLTSNEGGMALALAVTSGAVAGSFAENILRPKSEGTPEPKVSEISSHENLEIATEKQITR